MHRDNKEEIDRTQRKGDQEENREQTEAFGAGRSLCRRIAAVDAGLAVGTYLTRRMGLTKMQVKRLKFRENGITVNGERVRVTHLLAEGETLQLRLDEQAEDLQLLEHGEGELHILYEDADLIAVWKQAGCVVHPAHGHYKDTLANQLQGYFAAKGEKVRIRSIGRLDADTSGVLVFAKNQIAAQRLWQQREDGCFFKEYRAVCEGHFPETAPGWQKIDAPIAAKEGSLMEMCVVPDGRPAVTYYQVEEQQENCAVVRLRLATGRTHQIRVHMAWLGHPLAGDPIYGHGEAGRSHAQLCAYRAELRQPFTGERIQIGRRAASKAMEELPQ